MSFRSLAFTATALIALSTAQVASSQTLSSLPYKDNNSVVQNQAVYSDGTRIFPGHLLFGWTGSAPKAWDVDTSGFGHVVIESSALPTGAATASGVAAVVTALGSPLQAGGNVAVTSSALPTGGATSALQTSILAAENSNVVHTPYTTALGSSATYTGAARDAGAAVSTGVAISYFNAIFYADQAGTAYVDLSDDGTTWTSAVAGTALTASTPLTLTAPLLARYYRARLVNGSTAQTTLRVSTAFSRN